MKTLALRTRSRTEFLDITAKVQAAVSELGMRSGTVTVFVPHTTAGIVVNENWDEDVQADLLQALERLVPWEAGYRHGEGNSAAHCKAALVGSNVTWPVHEGKLALGTWQGVFLAEFDGPRSRHVLVHISANTGEE